MTEQEFLEELESVKDLAREISCYISKAWPMLAHKGRVFAIAQEARFIHPDSTYAVVQWGSIVIWLITGESGVHVGFSEHLGSYAAYDPYDYKSVTSSYAGVKMGDHLIRRYVGFDLDMGQNPLFLRPFHFLDGLKGGIYNLRRGLVKLFGHFHEECARCAREFASDEAVRRWKEYEEAFVERINNRYLMEYLVKEVRRLYGVSCLMRRTSWYTDSAFFMCAPKEQILQQIANPLEDVLKLVECVNQATGERKLFTL